MKELICDKFYRNGFELHHVDKLVTNRPIAVFDLKNTAKAYPSWQLAQWCCKNNLANGKERVKQDGTYEISDPSKKVTVDVEKGSFLSNFALPTNTRWRGERERAGLISFSNRTFPANRK